MTPNVHLQISNVSGFVTEHALNMFVLLLCVCVCCGEEIVSFYTV